MDNIMQLYLRQFSFFSLFGKCGKYANKIISLMLVFSTIFIFSIPTYAADSSGNISITDMNIYADETIDPTPSVDGGVVTEDITNELNINKLTSGSLSGYTQINFPATGVDNGEKRLFVSISLTDFIKLNSEHEYTLSYNWVYNVDLTASMNCALRFYDNEGNLLKEQILVAQAGSGVDKKHLVDISFVPDTTDIISGYKCELLIYFLQSGYNSNNVQRLYISDISLIDNDDDSGWFQKIINKINDVWESIKSLPDKIGVYISNIASDIGEKIKSLFIPEDGFFDAKKQEMETFLEEHFGVIFTAPNILITIIEKLLTVEVSEPIISFPKIQFDLLGTEYFLIDKEIHLNLSDFVGDGSPYHILYKFYRAFATGFLIVAFANYCKNKYDYLFGKDGEAV